MWCPPCWGSDLADCSYCPQSGQYFKVFTAGRATFQSKYVYLLEVVSDHIPPLVVDVWSVSDGSDHLHHLQYRRVNLGGRAIHNLGETVRPVVGRIGSLSIRKVGKRD